MGTISSAQRYAKKWILTRKFGKKSLRIATKNQNFNKNSQRNVKMIVYSKLTVLKQSKINDVQRAMDS